MAATDNITVVKNIQLDDVATEDTASHVCEPSLATNGDVVFYTGNWFAAISVDGGGTFRFVDPTSMFPASLNHDFCCDQVVQYIKKIDTFVWLLQATENADGENVQRLAMAKTADVKIGKWRIYDITSKSVGMNGAWLDFPDMAVGTNMLYVTTNPFQGNNWVGTVLVRIPLASSNRETSRLKIPFRQVISVSVLPSVAERKRFGRRTKTPAHCAFIHGAKPMPSRRSPM